MELMNSALPDVALMALLLALEPDAPEIEVAARVRRRVRVRLDDTASIITIGCEAQWKSFFPGAERTVLFDDGETLSWPMHLSPGVGLPKHEHDTGPEECLVLEGNMWHEGDGYRPGDYIVALQGSTHQETYNENGAVPFFRTPSPRRLSARAG
jgi:anti-sigma factor ChrR (cupin superfamily)